MMFYYLNMLKFPPKKRWLENICSPTLYNCRKQSSDSSYKASYAKALLAISEIAEKDRVRDTCIFDLIDQLSPRERDMSRFNKFITMKILIQIIFVTI